MSFWGKLGKIVAGVAAPFTGGLSLAAIPAIGAAEGAMHGGGWGGALRGAAGGALEAAIPGVGGAVLGKIPGAGGIIGKLMGGAGAKAGAGAATTAATQSGGRKFASSLTSSLLNNALQGGGGGGQQNLSATGDGGFPVTSGIPDATGVGTQVPGLGDGGGGGSNAPLESRSTTPNFSPLPASTVQGTGRSGLQAIIDSLKDPQNIADIGSAVGAFGQTEANNRSETGTFTQNHDRLRLAAEQDRRVSEGDAWRKLMQTSYVLEGGRPYSASAASPYTYGFGPKAPNKTMREAAGTLQGQLMDRLQPGAGFHPADLESYTKQGKLEKASNWGALIASVLAAARGGANRPVTPSRGGISLPQQKPWMNAGIGGDSSGQNS